jgi:hypothetical protein
MGNDGVKWKNEIYTQNVAGSIPAPPTKPSLPLGRDLRLAAHRRAARPKGLDRSPDPSLLSLPRRAPPPLVTSGDCAGRVGTDRK